MSKGNDNKGACGPVKGTRVAKALGVASSTVTAYVKAGKVRGFIINGKSWIYPDEADRLGLPAE
jgi:predicted site-specific integrase-resolvase